MQATLRAGAIGKTGHAGQAHAQILKKQAGNLTAAPASS
jgi:hypothetical protein